MTKNVFKKLMHSRRYHSTFRKFRDRVMLFIMIPVLFFNIFAAFIYSKKTIDELDAKIDFAYNNITKETEQQFSGIADIYMTLTDNVLIRHYMTSKREKFEAEITDFAPITAAIDNEYQRTLNVKEIAIYSLSNGYIISNIQSGYADKIQPEWYQRYVATGETDMVYSDDDNITIMRKTRFAVKGIAGGTIGIIVIKISKQYLREVLLLEQYNTDVAVKYYNSAHEELFSEGEVTQYKTKDYRIERFDIDVGVVVGEKNYRDVAIMIAIFTIVCLLICTLVAYVISIFLTKILYGGITDILAKMDERDEYGVTKVSENILSKKEEEEEESIETELAYALSKLQAAHMNSLRLQITPHFIFNVLNCVNIAILQNSNNDATTLIRNLSDILRYTMQEPKYSASVREETETTKKYVEIEKIKMDGELEAVWNIEEAVLDRNCTKLFLQPIIENAVLHGIKKLKNQRGRIEISAFAKGEDTIFVVKDNGIGIPPEMLKQLRRQLKEPFDDHMSHIGLRNVNERIRLIYGDKYGITIDSDENGTKVTIKIGDSRADEAAVKKEDGLNAGNNAEGGSDAPKSDSRLTENE